MSKFKTTPPLVSLCAVNTAQEVEIRLHEPLIQKPGSHKKRIGLQVLNALARLEVLLSKEEALASSENAVQHLAQQQYNKTEIEAALNVLETSLLQFEEDGIPKKDIQTYLSELGLSVLFPKSAKRLVVNNIPSGKVDALDERAQSIGFYFTPTPTRYKASESQIYGASDCTPICMCNDHAGGHFLKYKSRVELHFDGIKALTNNSEIPKLTTEKKEWLSQVTADIVTEALFSGRPVTAMSQLLATYLNEISETSPKID
ncbi:4315_t:CDS:2 [Cetraspora pellucida]|uniref:4315_t:CDS:1 n=1 Tax=Cetraspora pellucida TaxID=1433469 RepID=A0A9N9NVK7_9GLOM|nr:4315_t:CDS:2 [Cetraspora pellucida]